MKKTLAIILVAAVLLIALVACSSDKTSAGMLGFNQDQVVKTIIIDSNGVEKDITHKTSEIFAAVKDLKFVKSKVEKYDSSWSVDYGYIINFYVSGQDGYYSLVVNHGARAMDGYKYKQSTTGFYDIDNTDGAKDKLMTALNDIFYL